MTRGKQKEILAPPVLPVNGGIQENYRKFVIMLAYHLILKSMPIIAVYPPQIERAIYGNRATNSEIASHTLISAAFADAIALITLVISLCMVEYSRSAAFISLKKRVWSIFPEMLQDTEI